MALPPGLSLGPVEPDDWPQITRRWLETYRAAPFARNILTADYLEHHGRAIRAYRARSGEVLVIRGVGTLVGWAAYESPALLHFLYVRPDARRPVTGWDLTSALLSALPTPPTIVTHWTRAGQAIVGRLGARYVPHVFF